MSVKSWWPLLHVIILMCISITLFTSCDSRRIIVNSLEERDANEILVYLSSKGIDAIKIQAAAAGPGGGAAKAVMWDISVSQDQALEAMNYLNQVGLPRRPRQNLLNIFTGSGLVPSEMEQKIRYQAGLAEQIASTIRKMDGVLDAEVQISIPPEDPLNPTQKKLPITASVFIRHNGVLDDPNSHLLSKIKRLVAAGVPSLNSDNVTVVGERARSNELSSEFSYTGHEEAKQYVSVWTLVIAQESLSRFRIIFFGFIFSVLILSLMVVWLMWQIYPLTKSVGGVKSLFRIHPFSNVPIDTSTSEIDSNKEIQETEEKKPKESAADPAKKEKETLADKDVDQT